MVKKAGQRRFLLKCGYTNEQLDHMAPHEAHTIISETEKANREKREAQVKEMTSDMDYGCTKHDLWPEDAREIARVLTTLGYRKLGENEMIITKKEYEDYQDLLKNFDNYLFEYRKFAAGCIKDSRKDIVEKYHDAVKNLFDRKACCGYIEDRPVEEWHADNNDIAKQFSVEDFNND